jgi:hypothetical protein
MIVLQLINFRSYYALNFALTYELTSLHQPSTHEKFSLARSGKRVLKYCRKLNSAWDGRWELSLAGATPEKPSFLQERFLHQECRLSELTLFQISFAFQPGHEEGG